MQIDEFRTDSHKLMYHVDRVNQWLCGENIYPIYAEIGVSGSCNYRCVFCAFDYLKYKPTLLDFECFKDFVVTASRNGIKSIMLAGEGEPLLHNRFVEMISFIKENNIDVAVTSNAFNLTKKIAYGCLPFLSWFRASINAGRAETFSLIHNAKEKDFYSILDNLQKAVDIRNKRKYGCTIGAQLLLTPQNYHEVIVLANRIKNIGLDYFMVKPYSRHPKSINNLGFDFKDKDIIYLEQELIKISNGHFHVVFRRRAIDKLKESMPYGYCLGMPFFSFITSGGDVYPCSMFFGNKDFVLGNIYKENFSDIWEGRRRKDIMDIIRYGWNIKKCRKACRLDEINCYLWELKNPGRHVNFI